MGGPGDLEHTSQGLESGVPWRMSQGQREVDNTDPMSLGLSLIGIIESLKV